MATFKVLENNYISARSTQNNVKKHFIQITLHLYICIYLFVFEVSTRLDDYSCKIIKQLTFCTQYNHFQYTLNPEKRHRGENVFSDEDHLGAKRYFLFNGSRLQNRNFYSISMLCYDILSLFLIITLIVSASSLNCYDCYSVAGDGDQDCFDNPKNFPGACPEYFERSTALPAVIGLSAAYSAGNTNISNALSL